MSRTPRPVLLIDVDGVLNPFAARRTKPAFTMHQLAGYPVRLNPAHGPALLAFADRFDLVWATTWEDQANTLIGPILGLPKLPVIHFDFAASKDHKWPDIDRFIGDRPAIWLEDDARVGDNAWAQRRNLKIPTRIIKTNPGSGLLPEHLAVIERFATRLGL